MKSYYINQNIGQARYVVSYHDGKSKHKDGSKFYDIRIANNVTDLNTIIANLNSKNYHAE